MADRIFIFASPSSDAIYRLGGSSLEQTVALPGALSVPGQTTFFIAASGLRGDFDEGTPYCVVEFANTLRGFR